MNIQSSKKQLLRYPTLATLALTAGLFCACNAEDAPQAPQKEKTTNTPKPPQTTNQQETTLPGEPLPPPQTTIQQETTLPGEPPPPPQQQVTRTHTRTVIPQNAVGSVPCPPQQATSTPQ